MERADDVTNSGSSDARGRSARSGGAAAEQDTQQLPGIPAERPKGRATFILVWLMIVIGIAAALVIGARLASDNLIKPLIANQVEDQLSRNVQTIIDQELAAMLMTPNQSQELIVTEAEINRRIAAQPDLGPLDRARAEITTEGVALHLRAYGLSGVYRARIGISHGAATIEDGAVSGPLGFVLPVEELEQAANEAIAGSLNQAGMQITQIRLHEGAIALTVEATDQSATRH